MTSAPLATLLALQDLDTSIDQARHRLGHLPARVELAALAAERRSLEARRAGQAAARDAVVARQGGLEAELAATERRAGQVSRRLYSGEVSAARDLQALSSEIETLKHRASDLEDEALGVLEEREPLDAAVDALDREDAALTARQAVLEGEAAEGEAAVGAELDGLVAQRAAAAAAVPAELLATYDRIRAKLGTGAARLVGNHCGGCHLVLPATEIDRLKHLADGAVVTCDQCGRILVRT
jgi:predicted  nucleic acid-binding Zn-ribbon protein